MLNSIFANEALSLVIVLVVSSVYVTKTEISSGNSWFLSNVALFAKRVRDVALDRKDISQEIKNAFKNAYKEIDEELTLGNLKEIKKIISGNN